MAEISAKEVMALRNKTGLSMMECKRALQEADGDMETAELNLRKKLKGKMEGRTERAAGEGCIAIAKTPDLTSASMVEIRCETDFTAKNDKVRSACQTIAALALKAGVGPVAATEEMTALIDDLRITTGENISYARGIKVSAATIGSYLHHDWKTGVLLEAEGDVSQQTLGQICMHIAAAHPAPLGVSPDEIPAEVVEKEKRFRTEQAMESGKPREIAEKIVEGGMRKFYEEVALVEQPFVIDPSKKVKEIVGAGKLLRFQRWKVGQGE